MKISSDACEGTVPPIAVIQQQLVKVVVDFYSPAERDKLLAYPTAEKLIEVVQHGVEIPVPEFLTYYLFHTKRPGRMGYDSYSVIARDTRKAVAMLEGYIEFNGDSINWISDAVEVPSYIPEYIGESIGLGVLNRVHDLTEADWAKKAEVRGPHAPKVFGVAPENRTA